MDFITENDFDYLEFEKGDVLQERCGPCDKVYFILRGNVKIELEREGIRTTFALLNEGNLASSYFNFFENTPSDYHIEACSHVKCLRLTKAGFESIAQQMDPQYLSVVLGEHSGQFSEIYYVVPGLSYAADRKASGSPQQSVPGADP